MTTVALEGKFMCVKMMQFQERPPHPSLSPSLKKVMETFPSSHKIIVALTQYVNLGLFKLPKYEVTESVANHVFTKGEFQKKEVLLTHSVMFLFFTSLKTSTIRKEL